MTEIIFYLDRSVFTTLFLPILCSPSGLISHSQDDCGILLGGLGHHDATGEVQESQGREGSTKDGGVYRYLAPFVHQVGVLQRFGSLEMEMKFQLTSLNFVYTDISRPCFNLIVKLSSFEPLF